MTATTENQQDDHQQQREPLDAVSEKILANAPKGRPRAGGKANAETPLEPKAEPAAKPRRAAAKKSGKAAPKTSAAEAKKGRSRAV